MLRRLSDVSRSGPVMDRSTNGLSVSFSMVNWARGGEPLEADGPVFSRVDDCASWGNRPSWDALASGACASTAAVSSEDGNWNKPVPIPPGCGRTSTGGGGWGALASGASSCCIFFFWVGWNKGTEKKKKTPSKLYFGAAIG